MEKLLNYFRKEKLDIYFPPDEIENWKQLKTKYFSLGYKWIDFSSDYSIRKIRRYDRKNQREYNKRKNHESRMRTTFRGSGNIPIVYPPPTPSNMERYLMLERWSKNNIYNISNIAVYLYENFGLKPCQSYEPDAIFATYNNYSTRHFQTIDPVPVTINDRVNSYERAISRSNTYHAPQTIKLQEPSLRRIRSLPPVAPKELRPGAPSAPPSYMDLLDQET